MIMCGFEKNSFFGIDESEELRSKVHFFVCSIKKAPAGLTEDIETCSRLSSSTWNTRSVHTDTTDSSNRWLEIRI